MHGGWGCGPSMLIGHAKSGCGPSMLIGHVAGGCGLSMLIGWVAEGWAGGAGVTSWSVLCGPFRPPQAAVVRAVGELLRGAVGAAGRTPQPGPAGAGRRHAGRRRRAPALRGAAAARLPPARPAVSGLGTPRHPPPSTPRASPRRPNPRGSTPKESLWSDIPLSQWHRPTLPGRGAQKQEHWRGDFHCGGVAPRGPSGWF